MIDALLKLVPWYWRWLAILAAFAACFGYGFVKGAEHEEKNLDELRASIDQERAAVAARQAERKRLSDALIAEKDAKHDQDLSDAHRWWAAYVDGLQHGGDLGSGAQPVPVESKICNDEARDHELSGAVRAAEQDLRRAVTQYRAGLAPLLGGAEVQTADLVNLQDAWSREKLINAAP